jgi:hypothetical protein
MNAEIRAKDGIRNDFQYRRYLQAHGTAIMKYNATLAHSQVAHSWNKEDTELGNYTPFLYSCGSCVDARFQASDLKMEHLRSGR